MLCFVNKPQKIILSSLLQNLSKDLKRKTDIHTNTQLDIQTDGDKGRQTDIYTVVNYNNRKTNRQSIEVN